MARKKNTDPKADTTLAVLVVTADKVRALSVETGINQVVLTSQLLEAAMAQGKIVVTEKTIVFGNKKPPTKITGSK